MSDPEKAPKLDGKRREIDNHIIHDIDKGNINILEILRIGISLATNPTACRSMDRPSVGNDSKGESRRKMTPT